MSTWRSRVGRRCLEGHKQPLTRNVMDLRLTVKRALEHKQLLEERDLLLQVVTNLEPYIDRPASGKLCDLLHRFHLDVETALVEAQK